MTETNEAIDDAPEEVVADNESEESQENEEAVEAQDAEQESDNDKEESDDSGEVEFPKKAVNALNRKNKQIQKLRAQMRELEAKLNETPKEPENKEVNPDDFENYGDYINAQVEALVEQRMGQSQTDMQKQQLEQQKQALQAQRDQYIAEQATEFSQSVPDSTQVWEQNAAVLDALPQEIADIFYSLDNAPAAVYSLAKEGKLESLLYTNPNLAAYEIVNAQNKGLELMSKPKKVSQAPTPISKARGTGSVKKQLSSNDDVLKSLGLK